VNEPDDNRRIFDQGGTGTLIVDCNFTFNLGPQQLTAEEREQMQETVARARD
jgi:hypothetical protein